MNIVHTNVGVQMISHILAVYAQESDQIKSFVGSEKQIFKVFDELATTIIHKLLNDPEQGEEVLAMIQDSINYIRYDDMPVPELTDERTYHTFMQREANFITQLEKKKAKREKKAKAELEVQNKKKKQELKKQKKKAKRELKKNEKL